MPELPEVETVRRSLEATIPGRRIEAVELYRPDLRVPFPEQMSERLVGRRFGAIRRRSKYLLMETDGPETLLAHLGMSGSFLVRQQGKHPVKPHIHVRMTLEGGQELIYHDPRRFGLILLVPNGELAAHPLLSSLGPEPLEEGFTAAYLAQALAKRKGPIKPALMDASLVVGVGNIYASEALYRAGIHPQIPANQCIAQSQLLVENIRAVLLDAIASGGSTLR